MPKAMWVVSAETIKQLNSLVDSADAGAGPAKLKVYDGVVPANGDAALSGNTLLVEQPLGDPAFGDAVDAVDKARATANPISPAAILVGGAPSFFRVTDSNDVVKWQGLAGTTDEDLVVNASPLVAPAQFELSVFTVDQLEGPGS